MTYTGHIRNGAIVLDGSPELPEGTRVVVETVAASAGMTPATPNSLPGLLLKFAGTVKDMPADFARNHDHYIHGQPKK